MKLVGIFGGSFNPPHEGHLHIAQHAYDQMDLDEIWMLVTPQNPFKDPSTYAPLEHRMEMSHLLTEDHDWFKPTDIERHFSSTMTADSLALLSEMHPGTKFVWIMGADNLSQFHTWDREELLIDGQPASDWQYMMNKISIAVMHRPGEGENALTSPAARKSQHLKLEEPGHLRNGQSGWFFVDNPPFECSSTDIRNGLDAGDTVIPGLPAKIRDYIQTHNLYDANLQNKFNTTQTSTMANIDISTTAMTHFIRTINLVKSLASVSERKCLDHFKKSWQKSNQAGEFNNPALVEGEIADSAISILWLADLQNIDLQPFIGHYLNAQKGGPATETQQSVSYWCDNHYPNEDIRQRTLNLIEELAELSVAQGMEEHRATALISTIFTDTHRVNTLSSYKNALAGLIDYAQAENLDYQATLDRKMRTNRTRSMAQSQQRKAKKDQHFQGPTTP
jgi:nicotinate-nucleotide adenylyltransferase